MAPRDPRDPSAAPGPDEEPRADEDREAILARRALFIASAFAGLSLGSVACDPSPLFAPCLSVEVVDAGVPQPCLSPARIETPDGGASIDGPDASTVAADAGADAGDAGAPGRDASAPTPPQPCLAPPPATAPQPCLAPPVPRPCLKPVAPKDGMP